MASPFASSANAKLTFQIPSQEMGEDGYGNPKPVTQPLTIIAYLKPSNSQFRRTREGEPSAISGSEQLADTWKGYLVDPMLFPDSVRPGMEAIAEIATGLKNSEAGLVPRVEIGTFKLLFIPQSPDLIASRIEEVTPISGTFTRGN